MSPSREVCVFSALITKRAAQVLPKALVACLLFLIGFAAPRVSQAQTAQFSYALGTVGGGFSTPDGVALDKSGNVYVADGGSAAVYEVPSGCLTSSCVRSLGSGFVTPTGVAVDASGDVFVADDSNNTVKEMLAVSGSIPASPTINTLGSGFNFPTAVAVDGSGDVFVADSHNHAVKEMIAVGGVIPASPTINTLGGGFGFGNPQGIALDASGDVFIADWTNDAAYEIPTGCVLSSCVKTLATGFDEPQGIAVDGSGNVYVADTGHSELKEIVAVGGSIPATPTINVLLSGLDFPFDPAVNGSGSIFLSVADSSQVLELQTGVMNFGTLPVGQTTPVDSLTATFAISGYSGSFTPTIVAHYGKDYSVGAVSCTTTSGGENCSVTVTFQPTLPGGRKDALFVMNGTTQLTSELMGGVGQAPLSLVQPGVVTQLNPSTSYDQYNSAVDENGTVYVLSSNSPSGSNVYSVTKAGVVSTVPVSATGPSGIAIDGAGVLYIAQNTYSKVLVTYNTVTGTQGSLCVAPPSGGSACTTSVNNDYLISDAVDQLGNVFATDIEYSPISVVELTPAGNYITTAISPAITQPYVLAVDSSDNIFVGGYTINKIPASGTQTQINTVGASEGIAVDPAESVYATRYTGGGVAELPASGYGAAQANLDPTTAPLGLSLGSDGTLYVGDYGNLDKVDRSQGVIAFGEQNVNVASSAQVVGIYNGGNQNLTLSSFGVSGTGFAMEPAATNGCSTSLVIQPGQLCNVDVTATFPHAGTFSGTVTFTTNSLNTTSTTQTVNLSGFVYGPYVTTTQSAAFGNVDEGSQPTIQVTLTNNGYYYNAGLETYAETVPAGFSVSGGSGAGSCAAAGYSLAPNASCFVVVTFSPTQAIAYGGTVTIPISSSGGGGPWPSVTFSASGTGVSDTPVAALSPSPVTFTGQVAGSTSEVQAVMVSNTGGGSLTLGTIALSGTNPGDFAITTGSNACTNGGMVAGGTSCYVYVTFTPAAAGSLTATLNIPNDGAGSPQSVTLNGTGVVFSSNVGTAEAAQPVTVVITTAGTPSSIQALTQGAANLDFTATTGGNCTSTAYTVGQTCTVDVIFKPQAPGTRLGAVVLTNASGAELGIAFLPGTGIGPQVIFGQATQSVLGGGFSGPQELALDGKGDVYVADQASGTVNEIPLGCTSSSCVNTLASGFLTPAAIKIDGGGDIYFADYDNNQLASDNLLEEIPYGCTSAGCFRSLGSGFLNPDGIGVDANGDVFVSDWGNNAVKKIQAVGGVIPASPNIQILDGGFSGASGPDGLSLDISGNLYVADHANGHAVYELPAAGGYDTLKTISSAFNAPEDAELDGVGNVYVADAHNNAVYEILAVGGSIPASPTILTLATDFNGPVGVAVDGSGNVYVGDQGNARVVELNYATPPSLNFPTATTDGSTDTTDDPQTVTVRNNGNASLTFASIVASTNFKVDSGSTTCSTSTALAAGTSCVVGVDFTPGATGPLGGTLTLTDNALNATGATQVINLSGTATGLPAPTINWTPTTPITYGTALGSSDLNATATYNSTNVSGDGTFAYYVTSVGGTTATSSTILPGGAQQLCVQWTPVGDFTSDYSATSECVAIQVNAASTSINWTPASTIISPAALGSGQFNAAAMAGSTTVSSDGTFTYYVGSLSGPVATTSTVLPVGSDQLCVQWTPSSNYTADYNSSSQCISITVNAPTTITWTPTTPITYGTALGSGQFNAAAFSGASNISTDGTFAYYVGTVGGTAATTSTVLPGGSNQLCVQWTPLSSYSSQYSSASQCEPIQVNAATTSINWSPSSTTIIQSTGPTSAQLDAAAFAGSSNITADGTLTYSLSTVGGTPITVGSSLALGPATICVQWTPSSTYSADYNGTSTCLSSFTVINTQPTTTVVTSNANPVFYTNSVTFTATVTPTSGTIVPTGTVTFYDNGAQIGTGSLSASGTGASAIARFTTASLAIGTHPITASYGGDTNNQASPISAILAEVVEDFSVTANAPTSSTIEPGTSTTFTFTVSPVSPATTFPAAITLTAANLPTGATYTLSPASINSGAGSTSVTLTVTTPITTLARNAPPGRAPAPKWPLMAVALLLLPMAGKLRRAGRGLSRMLSLLLLVAAGLSAAAALSGCGGVPTGYFGQAPATSSITVTGASGSLNHNASVSLTVE